MRRAGVCYGGDSVGNNQSILEKIEIKDILLLLCGFCCVNMVLFTLIPVTVERSVSVFMLSYMEENDDQTYNQADIEDIFINKYVHDYGAFEKRFNEQIVSGNIVKNEDKTYKITLQGKNCKCV